jgi:tRNA modification GTPase
MRSAQDTIAAIATPVGESGIGVVRLSGPSALAAAQALFQSSKSVDLTASPSHRCYVGYLQLEGRRIDQAVVTLFRAPHSYTGDDIVEISAHGSPFILNQILDACVKAGARLAGPGEFTERAFLAGKIDLTQAEAVADLIRAKTDRAHAAALAQLEGRLAKKVCALRDRLLPLLAHVEVGLDHSDEDHDFLARERLSAQCLGVREEIDSILASARVGKILREGLRVALVGRPNVGKSSLLNALLKEERAIVTPVPGTTRDTLEETINWDGLPVVLTDTAGMRGSEDPVERLGMERSRKALQGADLVLGVFDASEPLSEEDTRLIEACAGKPFIAVLNKIDLPAPVLSLTPGPSPNGRGERSSLSYQERVAEGRVRLPSPTVHVSAKTGEGLEELVHAVKTWSLSGADSAAGAQWMINARHQTALTKARQALDHALEAARQGHYEECVALELQTALQALGEILGESSTEDLLDQIFSKFCIGK